MLRFGKPSGLVDKRFKCVYVSVCVVCVCVCVGRVCVGFFVCGVYVVCVSMFVGLCV